jgi:DNA-binding IclR family transcriptional regulator
MAEGLSELEVSALRLIKDGRSLDEIAKIAGAPAATLGRTIARLQINGFLAEDGSVTAKGIQALAGQLGASEG